jgi:predicted kinase
MLYLLRGLPGSGKSTYAKSKFGGALHLESDMYFVCGSQYIFDHRRLSAAHVWCAKTARRALETGMDVVVSNTFTQYWELAPYINMANEMRMPYRIYEIRTQFQCVHDVPNEKVEVMKKRWEDINDRESVVVVGFTQ